MFRRYLPLILIVLLPSVAFSQSKDEKIFERQSIKKIRKTIASLSEKGYVPMEVAVASNGRKASFSARLVRPKKPFPWVAEFEISDDKFEERFQSNRAKQLRLVAHEEYELKKTKHHACIWHFDADLAVLSPEETKATAKRPKPQPLDTIWQPESKVPSVGTQGGDFEQFENRTVEYMRANQIPALSVALVVRGKPVYEAAFGYGDLERKIKAKPGVAFGTGWFSRLITVIAVLQLAEKGKLNLDQPAFPLVGIEPWRESTEDQRLNKITIRQLLQETGGHDPELTTEPGFNPRFITKKMGLKSTVNSQQLIQYMMSQPLSYEPGTKRVSSAYSALVLAKVIEKVSGVSYEDYILANIKKPLKLKTLVMQETAPDARPDNCLCHYQRGGGFYSKLAGENLGSWVQLTEGGIDFRLVHASHGWTASPMDLLTIGRALQADPSPLLSRHSKKILVAMPEHVRNNPESDKRKVWLTMGGLRVQKSKKGMDFWMTSRGTCSTASVVCFASENSRCFTMNCSATIGGRDPDEAYRPIINQGLSAAIKMFK